ncbi:MAG TPA: FmdE family protein [candidate division Zixibacteria bacterium]|nr:FmdE family protein [candidate division Zixibacteria bacterium]
MSAPNVPDADILNPLLEESASLHHHLCPRQVLGVRIGLLGLRLLGFINDKYEPRFNNDSKRLLAIVEINGCGVDGVSVATGCWIGRRTLRIVDAGKVAATLVDTVSGRAFRVSPSHESRSHACNLAPEASSRWHAYLQSYQSMADDLLLKYEEVQLLQSVEEIISYPEALALCDECGEEIFNAREEILEDRLLCLTCAGYAYYRIAG